jgi:hypothetical protein
MSPQWGRVGARGAIIEKKVFTRAEKITTVIVFFQWIPYENSSWSGCIILTICGGCVS